MVRIVRFGAVIVAVAALVTWYSPPAAASTVFATASTDGTHAFYAYTRDGGQLSGPSKPVPIPGLSITLPAGSQNGPKFALVTLNMPTLSMTCDCMASGAFYLAVGANRFASGEFTVNHTGSSGVFSPMTIVAAIPLTFSQQVVVAEWATGPEGSTLVLGPWASLSAILLATLNR